jgi:pRiA4b ORF-3-like protein
MAEPSGSSIAIYRLRVLLCGVAPLVFRRLLVASDTSIAQLHGILQSAFDWSDEHMHRFLIHGTVYGLRILAALSSGKMLHGCRFPVSVCIAASVSPMNTTSPQRLIER